MYIHKCIYDYVCSALNSSCLVARFAAMVNISDSCVLFVCLKQRIQKQNSVRDAINRLILKMNRAQSQFLHFSLLFIRPLKFQPEHCLLKAF